MGKYCQVVIGPAGSGKSSYCHAMCSHMRNAGRDVHVVNLDAGAESFFYTPSIDIRELISVSDVIDELEYGPNGAQIFCYEFLTNNMDWFTDKLNDYMDDYLLIDSPGQIELFTHYTFMRKIVEELVRCGYKVCTVYILDSHYTEDVAKYFSGVLNALSTMMRLEVAHINLLSKVDRLTKSFKNSRHFESFLIPDSSLLTNTINSKYDKLNRAIGQLVEDNNLVSFIPMSSVEEETLDQVMYEIDNALQYGEDKDVDDMIDDD